MSDFLSGLIRVEISGRDCEAGGDMHRLALERLAGAGVDLDRPVTMKEDFSTRGWVFYGFPKRVTFDGPTVSG